MGGKTILKGRLNGAQRTRLGGLLDMMYRPSEIADEVGFETRQFYRVYIPAGCPHERDSRRHLWVNGEQFRNWYRARYKKITLASDEAYCLTCKTAVKMVQAVEHVKDGLTYQVCNCPGCGRRLARIMEMKR